MIAGKTNGQRAVIVHAEAVYEAYRAITAAYAVDTGDLVGAAAPPWAHLRNYEQVAFLALLDVVHEPLTSFINLVSKERSA